MENPQCRSTAEPITTSKLANILSDPDERLQQLHNELQSLEGRDLQLWAVAACLLIVITAGFLSLISPQIAWNLNSLVGGRSNLPQLLLGLIVLLALLNIYLFHERGVLQQTRRDLIRQLIIAEKVSNVDSLTGVFNRRCCRPLLQREIARAERQHTTLSVMVVDIDDFKSFNTRFGHVTGDSVLVEVANLLCQVLRRSDAVIRYGGDEFLVLMSDTNLKQAGRAMKRFQQVLEKRNFTESTHGYRVGASCGVAEFTAGMTQEMLIAAADRTMYSAKSDRSKLMTRQDN